MVEPQGEPDVLFRVSNEVLVQVAQQQILKRRAQELDAGALARRQVASNDPGLIDHIRELVFSAGMVRDARCKSFFRRVTNRSNAKSCG